MKEEKRRVGDGQREPKLSGRSQRYVGRVLLSGIKKRFVIRPKGGVFATAAAKGKILLAGFACPWLAAL